VTGVVATAVQVRPDQSSLTGVVPLARVTGTDTVIGVVMLNLAAGSYAPTVIGVDPDSTTITDMATALTTYFALNGYTIPLGTVQQANVQHSCLLPTDFTLATMTAPAGTAGNGCLLLLIQTDGAAGTSGPTPNYPIPDGDNAALLVSARVLYGVLVPALNTEMATIGTTFAPNSVDTPTALIGSGGSLNLGQVGQDNEAAGDAYSCDVNTNPAPVVITPVQPWVIPANDGFAVAWSQTWSQYWTFIIVDGYDPHEHLLKTSDGTASWNQQLDPAVDPVTCVVSFSGNGAAAVTAAGNDAFWRTLFSGHEALPAAMQSFLAENMNNALGALTLPDIGTFALQSLLFPGQHRLSLGAAAVPDDLVLSGTIRPVITVEPQSSVLGPGGSIAFTAITAGTPLTSPVWSVSPDVGSFDNSDSYWAPTTLAEPTVVFITAIDPADSALTGSAAVLLLPPLPQTGLVLTPSQSVVTAGASLAMTVTDTDGRPVIATVEVTDGPGRITAGLSTGQWWYIGPYEVTTATQATVTATDPSNPSHTGTATITVATSTTITVTASAGSVGPAATATVTATTDLDEVSWVVYPQGSGTIASIDGTTQATFTAPSTISAAQQRHSRRLCRWRRMRRRHRHHQPDTLTRLANALPQQRSRQRSGDHDGLWAPQDASNQPRAVEAPASGSEETSLPAQPSSQDGRVRGHDTRAISGSPGGIRTRFGTRQGVRSARMIAPCDRQPV